ncbi:MAG: ABC transporter permease [Bacteroidetes bacterium]|nr:ABC transporter permease [Bacteroidota bacterium]
MFKNYLLLAVRNMRKNKLHTFINIGGMAVAFTCSIFILLLVYRHFTYDDFELNKDNIYKVYNYSIGPSGEETGTSMAYPLTPALKTDNIGVERATSILNRGRLVRYGDKTLDMPTTLVDPDFLKMFTFPVVQGNAVNPLSSTSNVVLTQLTAEKLFGKENPIGKQVEVKLAGQWYKLVVSAILKDVPENSTIKFSLLARTELDPDYAAIYQNWDNQNHPVYVQLKNNVTQQQAENRLRFLSKKYLPEDAAAEKRNGFIADKNGDFHSFHLLPFTLEHFSPELSTSSSVSKPFLYVLILISCVILLIASFNFVNLNVGLSFARTKEIGIRKCLGAGKKQIWLQVWGESFIMVLVSVLLSIAGLIILIKNFNETFSNTMDAAMLLRPVVVCIIVLMMIVVSFIASGYPSTIMAKLKTVEILKGKLTVKRPGVLRNALIVTQFVIAITLICCTMIIYQQFNYLRSAPLGYNTTTLISIPIKDDERGREIVNQMRTRLATQGSVISVTGSDVNLGMGNDHSSSTSISCFTYGDKTICGQTLNVDIDFLKALGIAPISGHDFSMDYAADTGSMIIATKSYAGQFGKNTTAGFSYFGDSTEPKITIAAIIPDIRLKSFNDIQKPLAIFLTKNERLDYIWIRVRTGNLTATMDIIKKTYASVEPGVEFNGSYVNENIDRLYSEERMMANLFSVAAIIAIILSCMGLFGMASIITRQRIKEIGVRKVLGASVSGIVVLVSKEFIRPVIIALFIAVPIAWWAMIKWLQNYSFRIHIEWWVFVLAGVAAIVVTACTISFQSIKAALTNPVKSLRTE